MLQNNWTTGSLDLKIIATTITILMVRRAKIRLQTYARFSHRSHATAKKSNDKHLHLIGKPCALRTSSPMRLVTRKFEDQQVEQHMFFSSILVTSKDWRSGEIIVYRPNSDDDVKRAIICLQEKIDERQTLICGRDCYWKHEMGDTWPALTMTTTTTAHTTTRKNVFYCNQRSCRSERKRMSERDQFGNDVDAMKSTGEATTMTTAAATVVVLALATVDLLWHQALDYSD